MPMIAPRCVSAMTLLAISAERGAIDDIPGNQRALKAEFGINRDFARVTNAVAFDEDVRGGVSANCRKCAVADAIASHHHVFGSKDVYRVAVLSGSAGAAFDVLNDIVRHEGCIVARYRSPHLDAVVAGA